MVLTVIFIIICEMVGQPINKSHIPINPFHQKDFRILNKLEAKLLKAVSFFSDDTAGYGRILHLRAKSGNKICLMIVNEGYYRNGVNSF